MKLNGPRTEKDFRRRSWYYGQRRRTLIGLIIKELPEGKVFRTSLIWKIIQGMKRPDNWEKSQWFSQESTVERALIDLAQPGGPIEGKKTDLIYAEYLDDGCIIERTRKGWLFRKRQ